MSISTVPSRRSFVERIEHGDGPEAALTNEGRRRTPWRSTIRGVEQRGHEGSHRVDPKP